MKYILLFLIIAGTIYSQKYSELFEYDLPPSLLLNREMFETQLSVNLSICEKVDPLLAGYYLEFLIAKFDKKVLDPGENYFSAFNSLLNKSRELRNDFIEKTAQKLLRDDQGAYNMYGLDIINRLKEQIAPYDEVPQNQILPSNKLYYYAYKLLSKDISLIYDPSEDYGARYESLLDSSVAFVNNLPDTPDEISKNKLDQLESFLIDNLYLVKNSPVNTLGIKTNKNLYDLIIFIGDKYLRQSTGFFVGAGFNPLYKDLNYHVETFIVYNERQSPKVNDVEFDMSYVVNINLGYRFSLNKYFGMFSYVDVYGGVFLGFVTNIHNRISQPEVLPFEVDYSDYPYDYFEIDNYRLRHHEEVRAHGFNMGLSVPLFISDNFIKAGISADIQYVNFKHEFTWNRRLVHDPDYSYGRYNIEHFSDISVGELNLFPGGWVSITLFDIFEMQGKYMLDRGISTTLFIHYEL